MFCYLLTGVKKLVNGLCRTSNIYSPTFSGRDRSSISGQSQWNLWWIPLVHFLFLLLPISAVIIMQPVLHAFSLIHCRRSLDNKQYLFSREQSWFILIEIVRLHLCYMFRPLLRPFSGTSIQKYYKGRHKWSPLSTVLTCLRMV